MATQRISGFNLIRDFVFGIVCVVSVSFVLVAQAIWMILFDITGVDIYVPIAVFTQILPAITVALIPVAVARYLYDRRVALVAGGIVFVASIVVSTFTIRFFLL